MENTKTNKNNFSIYSSQSTNSSSSSSETVSSASYLAVYKRRKTAERLIYMSIRLRKDHNVT